MKNLSSFSEFSNGSGKPQQSINFSIPVSGSTKPITVQSENKEPDVENPLEDIPSDEKKKVKRFQRALQRMTDENPDTRNQNSFKVCYDVVEAEYMHILKELNRIEYGDNEMKKPVTELKKAFNDLLVKLQFFGEADKK